MVMLFSVKRPTCNSGKDSKSRASSGPRAMPTADAPTKPADALVRCAFDTKSAM